MKPTLLSVAFSSAAIFFFGAANSAWGADKPVTVFRSEESPTSLLELYTSEGCNSCPPAETWLSGLKGAPGLWRDFAPVAFHVDYWDNLGWRDPWGSPTFSDRERAYAQRWRSPSIYTPCFVLNGKEWRGWREPAVDLKPTATKVGVLTASSADATHWKVVFTPSGGAGAAYQAHAALQSSALVSEVKAGENRGRRLEHDFVTLALTSAPLTTRGNMAEGELILKGAVSSSAQNRSVVVWVTRAGHAEPIQSTGGWLPAPAQ